MVQQLGQEPLHYTLALDGNVQRLTAALDVDGNAMAASGTVNVWANDVHLQLSNDAVAGTDICFIAYKSGGSAPSTLTKANAMLDLTPGQSKDVPASDAANLRGTQINVRHLFAKGVNGDFLHIIIPRINGVSV